MEKLKLLLKERGLEIKDDQLKAKVSEFGYDPNKLSDDNAKLVADELTKKSAAIATNPAKPTNGNGKPPQAGTNVEGLQRSMMEAWTKQETNLKAFTGRLETRKQTAITNWVEENYQIINSTSQDAVDALARKLQEVESDQDNFLGLANRIPEQFSVVS